MPDPAPPWNALPGAAAAFPAEVRSWRWRIFAATFLCYAGMYFCRKPFSIVKSALGKELGFDAASLGTLGAAYLIAYTLGQFVAGGLGQRFGARLLLLAGMGLSVACGIGFGLSNSYAVFLLLMVLNGFAQATGWSGNVSTMAAWFHRQERGKVMGIWATNFQVGGVLANTLAAWALGAYGFRWSFFSGAVVLLAVQAFFLFNQRNRPEDLGFAPIGSEAEQAEERAVEQGGWSRVAIENVLLVGTFYFFVKFIRYALWSWAPFFLERNLGLKGEDAGYLSTLFDLFGVAGTVVTGWLSDRFFGSLRAGISLIMMVGLSAGCLALLLVGGSSATLFGVCIAAVGFCLYGPDALMTGAGAMDIGSRRRAALAAGIINGMGSFGSVVQDIVIGKSYVSNAGNLATILGMLLAAALGATLMMGVIVLRNRSGVSRV